MNEKKLSHQNQRITVVWAVSGNMRGVACALGRFCREGLFCVAAALARVKGIRVKLRVEPCFLHLYAYLGIEVSFFGGIAMSSQVRKKQIKKKTNKCCAQGLLKRIDKELDIVAERSVKLSKRTAKGATSLYRSVCEDVNAVRERDPAARSNAEVLLLYSGVHALIAHRIAHGLYRREHYFSARAISQISRAITGIEIHPGATIGKGLMIDHGMGVVIGETAEIGDNCTIYQGVTLGGTGKDVGKRHPTLGNNVMVGAGAKVLGPFKIGDNVKIAANAVVLEEIPSQSTAVGIPAKVVRRQGVKIENDLDQIHIPDPVAQELKKIEEKLSELQAELDKVKGEN